MSGIQQGLLASYTAAAPAELPAGTVLIFDRPTAGTAIPSGWSLYLSEGGNSIINYTIKGGTATVRSTGNTVPVSLEPGVYTVPPAGAHSTSSPPSLTSVSNTAPTSPTLSGAQVSAGAHNHTVTVTGFPVIFPGPATVNWPNNNLSMGSSVQGMNVPLIQTASAQSTIPAGAIIFSGTSTVFTGFTRKLWPQFNPNCPQTHPNTAGMYSVSGPRQDIPTDVINNTKPLPLLVTGPDAIFSSSTFVVSSSGAHTHTGSPTNLGGPGTAARAYLPAGTHTHGPPSPQSVGWWKQFKHLLPTVSTSAQEVKSGMIVMFNGSTVPPGWLLCDGTNGTPNMVGFFLGYNNSISTSDNIVGNNAVGAVNNAIDNSPIGPGWPTTPAPVGGPITQLPFAFGVGGGNPHTHASPTAIRTSPLKSVYHDALLPGGHTHSVAKFNPEGLRAIMPTNFEPPSITLIFIQKA